MRAQARTRASFAAMTRPSRTTGVRWSAALAWAGIALAACSSSTAP